MIGRSGSGKSSVINAIVGENVLRVVSDLAEPMARPQLTCDYTIQHTCGNVIKHMNCHFMELCHYPSAKESGRAIHQFISDLEGVNLIIFVYRNGRFTAEDKDFFQMYAKLFKNYIRMISALVITHCEGLNNVARVRIVNNFNNNQLTKDIAATMHKGICTVGFPDLTSMHEHLRREYMGYIQEDSLLLIELLKSSSNAVDDII